MDIESFPFQVIDWNNIPVEEHTGIAGKAYCRVFRMNDIRIRMVEYSPGYTADHWCNKGHILFCTEGEMETELADGRKFILSQGSSYHVGDTNEAHRSISHTGCKLFIVD